MPTDSPAQWVSVRAVAWVLDEAPDLPANLLPVLMSLARHADAGGRGTWLSKHRLGWSARKTDQQVKRDLKQLRELGLIRLGDQGLVAHLPADKRPTVYDLAMERRRPPYEPPPGGLGGTPAHRGASQGPSRGASQGEAGGPTGQNGGPSRAPKEELEEEIEKRSPRASADAIVRELTDATEEETRELLRRIIDKHHPSSLAAYVGRMGKEGDLKQWLYDLRAENRGNAIDEARQGPACPHGEPGGASPHPQTGQPLCPMCRTHMTVCRLDPAHCPKCQGIREAAGLPPDPRSRPEEP